MHILIKKRSVVQRKSDFPRKIEKPCQKQQFITIRNLICKQTPRQTDYRQTDRQLDSRINLLLGT